MIDWHERFQDQLNWTKNLRDHLYQIIDMENKESILEIGCGTGALLEEVGLKFKKLNLHGIDIDTKRLEFAKKNLKKKKLMLIFNI